MWGKPGDGEGEFNFHRSERDRLGGIAVDQQGNVYVADNVNKRIQKFDSNGSFLLQWGGEGSGDGQFRSPIGVALDPQGDVYVIDDSRNDIQKFDNHGTFLSKIGGVGFDDGEFYYTGNLEIDRQGNIYVADFGNQRVQKFDSQGNFLMKWGSEGQGPGQFSEPAAIAVDSQGNVYVVEFGLHEPENHRVQVFDEAGNYLGTWGVPGLDDGEFFYPFTIAIDSEGYVYVGDEAHRIQKFKPLVSSSGIP
jgi:DNA-binding beta-propeller fold protein YncE